MTASTLNNPFHSPAFIQIANGSISDNAGIAFGYVWPVQNIQKWTLGVLKVSTSESTNFGTTVVGGAPNSKVFLIRNSSGQLMDINGIYLSGTDSDQFSVIPGGTVPCSNLTPKLAAGGACTVVVTAQPTSIGVKTANLTITTTEGIRDIPLTATAISTVFGCHFSKPFTHLSP